MDVASENTLSPTRVHWPPCQLAFDHSDCFMESWALLSASLLLAVQRTYCCVTEHPQRL